MKKKFNKRNYKKPLIQITKISTRFLRNRSREDYSSLLEAHWVLGSWDT